MTQDLYISFSVLLASGLLAPSLVFSAHALSNHTERHWRSASLGACAIFLAAIISALREYLPIEAPFILTNFLVGVGYFLLTRAMREVLEVPDGRHIELRILIAHVAIMAIVALLQNTYELRVLFVSTSISLSSILVGVVAYRGMNKLNRIGCLIIILFSVGNGVVAASRSVAVVLNKTGNTLNLGTIDPIFFIWSVAASLIFGLGYFSLGSVKIYQSTLVASSLTESLLKDQKRLTRELEAALSGQKNLQKLVLHEIKRPISAISAQLQLSKITGEVDTEKLTRLIEDATAYLSEISNFGDISDLFSCPNMKKISTHEIANDIILKWNSRVEISRKDVDIFLEVDMLLVDIAIGNLLENAEKFSSEKSNVLVRIHSCEDFMNFDVSDDGPGIPDEERENVWKKFYKIGSTTQNAIKGCGLGLYVVSEIATLHRGCTKVLDTDRSTIRFSIPYCKF